MRAMAGLDRRELLKRLAGSMIAGGLIPATAARSAALAPMRAALGEPEPFSFDKLRQTAQSLAGSPWRPADRAGLEPLSRIDYDAYQQIRFSSDATLMLGAESYPVQLFHLSDTFRDPVRIHLVERELAREVIYSAALFDTPPDHPARELPDGIGFAGFRVMDRDVKTDWLSFLGASYFRTSGPFNQYGLSARALAIDTGLATPEEFPRFTTFWLEEPQDAGAPFSLYALLDSPSVAGAYRMTARRASDGNDVPRIVMEIEAELFARRDIARLGIAPFSSMFWYGETGARQALDWRPEIHDSDGLALWTGAGERIWRPLNNPPRVMTNTFVDRDVKGFGLLQRDRDFVHYLDDGVFYERRPSVWVEPAEPWGEGAVHLLEIPTDDEIHDNIAAYWCPSEPFKAGASRRYSYRLSWLDTIPFPSNLARATATWTGRGGRPGARRPSGLRKFVIDFQGAVLDGLGRDDGVEVVVTNSRGEVSNAYTHPVVDQRERWRALFDLDVAGPEVVDMRAYLKRGDTALTETWVYQYFPDT